MHIIHKVAAYSLPKKDAVKLLAHLPLFIAAGIHIHVLPIATSISSGAEEFWAHITTVLQE